MPDRCVVFGCSNLANVAKGISLHRIPFLKRRKKRSKAQEKAMDRLCQGYTRQVGPNQEYGCMLGALYSRLVFSTIWCYVRFRNSFFSSSDSRRLRNLCIPNNSNKNCHAIDHTRSKNGKNFIKETWIFYAWVI